MTTALRPSPARARSTSSVRVRRERAVDVGLVVAANAALVVALWLRHGGLDGLGAPGGALTAAGQLTALVGTYAVLVQLLLISRITWLEQAIGFDRLAVWHRWAGFGAVTLLTAHVAFTTLGFAASSGQSLPTQLGDLVEHYPDVLMAFVGFGLFLAVAVSSVRAARRRIARETWYSIHLYAYLAIALTFAHQLAVGTDFSDDTIARAWWVALYVAVFGAILWWRVGRPVAFNLRHRLRIVSVKPEADGVVSLHISGRRLDEVAAEPGQFFLWRFLVGTGWAKAHPFSLSAAPDGRRLRITVKDLGDDTRRMQRLRPGVRVFAEGPYGTFTAARSTAPHVVLIAGGIGITPLRALLESLPHRRRRVTLLYRAATEGDVAFAGELEALGRKGIDVHVLVGSDIGDDTTDQLGCPALQQLVPDIASCDVFLCGPPAMLTAVRRRLAMVGVPRDNVHFERFEY